MTTATLTPRREAATEPPRQTPPRRPAPRRRMSRPRPERRMFVIGLALSALAHVALFIYMYFTFLPNPTVGGAVSPTVVRPVGGALEVVELVAVEGQVPEEEEAFSPTATPVPIQPGARAGFAEDAAAAAPDSPVRTGPSAIERLEPHMGDERVWTDPSLLSIPQPTGIERARERVASELGAWNDSIAAAEEAAARARDWTIEGENGERWGISPDGIHLGRITLPAPVFGASAKNRERALELDQIQDMAGRARIYDRFDDRVEAIRARKDAERAKKKSGGN